MKAAVCNSKTKPIANRKRMILDRRHVHDWPEEPVDAG
jgi:hypothetical protein